MEDIIEIEGQRYKRAIYYRKTENEVYYKGAWYFPIQEEDKNWEILRFSDGFNTYYKSRSENPGKFTINFDHFYDETSLLNRKDIIITSVRRLSDDQIFFVGDKVSCSEYGGSYAIESLSIGNYNPHTRNHKGIYVETSDFGMYLDNIRKAKEPLFTTEDSVELWNKEDKVYSVLPKSHWPTHDERLLDVGILLHKKASWVAWKHFSSEEARNKYILENKPVLSFNDVIGITIAPGIGTWLKSGEIEELRELVKSKIK